ncbi:hypothetical protein ACGFYY_15805 [Streptomyces sp. NPDC048331]|uniref:hypothetical protein n=1 Tax=Streptomyces sp. NPDC048331 TaxID=3365534 RepID=UPI003718B698
MATGARHGVRAGGTRRASQWRVHLSLRVEPIPARSRTTASREHPAAGKAPPCPWPSPGLTPTPCRTVRSVRAQRHSGPDVLATSDLDDRTSSQGVVEDAQAPMAEAVGAEHAFIPTCDSSLSVKSAMLSMAGPHEKLVVGRDTRKSVVSGLVLSGTLDRADDRPLPPTHPFHSPGLATGTQVQVYRRRCAPAGM